mgnify:CR=1 FL=1
MMRFLKTILSKNSHTDRTREELYMLKRDIDALKMRVELLEEEHKKSLYAITELSTCVQNVAVLVSDLSVDVNAFGLYLKAQLDQDLTDTAQAGLFSLSDDDDGYLN